MAQTVILHIGIEKTGTTTLQAFFNENAVRLAEQGFHYPTDQEKSYVFRNMHGPIAAALLGRETEFLHAAKVSSLKFVLSELAADLKSTRQMVILSAEHLSSRLTERGQLELLKKAIEPAEVKIICYVRNPADLALAAYSEGVKRGRSTPFETDSLSPSNRYFNAKTILDFWSSVFGREAIEARVFDRQKLIGADIRADASHLLGIRTDGFVFGREKNVSLDASQCEALRYLNEVMPSFQADPEAWRLAMAFRQRIWPSLPKGQPLASLLDASTKAAISQRFQEVRLSLARDYLGGQDPFPGLSEDASEKEKNAQREIHRDDLAQSLRGAVIGLSARLHDLEVSLAKTGNSH